MGWNLVAGVDTSIHTNTRTTWRVIAGNTARCWKEAILWIFGINAEFNGVAFEAEFILGKWKCFAGSNSNLLDNNIDTCDGLGNGVFHLQASVHLHKEKVMVFINQKLHSSGINVINSLGCLNCNSAHFFTQLVIDVVGGGNLNQLLITTLD